MGVVPEGGGLIRFYTHTHTHPCLGRGKVRISCFYFGSWFGIGLDLSNVSKNLQSILINDIVPYSPGYNLLTLKKKSKI